MAFILKPAAIFCLLVVLLLLHSSSCKAHNILYSGETLHSGNQLEYGSFSLRMQADCNMVLYDIGTAVWSTNTHGMARDCRCVMQRDRNLVIYAPSGAVIWASNTWTRTPGSYVLILQRDLNLVISGPQVWDTRTNLNAHTLHSDMPAVTVVNNTTAANANTTAPGSEGFLQLQGAPNECRPRHVADE